MEYRVAIKDDIEGVLSLHRKYHVDTVSDKDRDDGFVTTQLNEELLSALIVRENGLFVAVHGDKIVAYVMVASWEYCSQWPLFRYMIERLDEEKFLGMRLSRTNSYQYGPICIDKEYRGSGVLANIFDLARREMGKKYPILVTFINKKNPRSAAAHIDKLGLAVVKEFEYNENCYFELVYDTSKSVKLT